MQIKVRRLAKQCITWLDWKSQLETTEIKNTAVVQYFVIKRMNETLLLSIGKQLSEQSKMASTTRRNDRLYEQFEPSHCHTFNNSANSNTKVRIKLPIMACDCWTGNKTSTSSILYRSLTHFIAVSNFPFWRNYGTRKSFYIDRSGSKIDAVAQLTSFIVE